MSRCPAEPLVEAPALVGWVSLGVYWNSIAVATKLWPKIARKNDRNYRSRYALLIQSLDHSTQSTMILASFRKKMEFCFGASIPVNGLGFVCERCWQMVVLKAPTPSPCQRVFVGGKFGLVLGSFRKKRANLEVSLSGAAATPPIYLAFVGWVEPKAKPNASKMSRSIRRFRTPNTRLTTTSQ